MKNKLPEIVGAIFLIFVALCIVGSVNNRKSANLNTTTIEQPNPPGSWEPYDFVMNSRTAVSNATLYQKPPEGYTVVCDHNGRFAPAYRGTVLDISAVIRTSRWEAIVATWRVKEVRDNPPPEKAITHVDDADSIWKPCN